MIGSFKQVLKSDRLLCSSKAVSLAGKKKVLLRAKNVTLYPSPVINEWSHFGHSKLYFLGFVLFCFLTSEMFRLKGKQYKISFLVHFPSTRKL